MTKAPLTVIKTTTLLIGSALYAQAALASGYHFGTQSVSSQATANTSAAEAADPSTIFYNPAGLTELDGTQATINLNIVAPSVKYKNAEAEYPASALSGGKQQKVEGSNSGKIVDDITFAPHLYASHKINDKWAFGLGVYVPFGSATEYDKDSVLRYNLNRLGLQTIAIQPTLAYKINDHHSVAVGLVAQHTKAHLRQFANFGSALQASAAQSAQKAAGAAQQYATAAKNAQTAAQNATDPVLAAQYAAQAQAAAAEAQKYQGLATQAAAMMSQFGNGKADGYADVHGGDWGFGYNLAWLWKINDAFRMGVNYRSKVDHTLRGDAEWKLSDDIFSDPALGQIATQGIRSNGYAAKEDARVKITTPESLSVHGMWTVNPKWNVFGDLTWTRHSRFNKAYLQFGHDKLVADPQTGSTTTSNTTILNPNWRNTWRVGVGASYQVNDPLQLRFGISYDQSPVRSSQYRMSTLPDANRIWYSLGAKYDINKQNTVNVAYSYIYIQGAKANVNGWCGGTSSGAGSVACVSSRTNGSTEFKSHAQILGVQYTYKF